PPNPSPTERRQAYLLLGVSTFFLALNHVIGRGVHEHVPPIGLSFWRWVVAALVLLPVVLIGWRETLGVYRAEWRAFVLTGALVVGATTLIMVALNFTSATNTALINATQPVLTVLLSRLVYRVPVSGRQALGIFIAFAGVVVMVARGSWATLVGLDFQSGDLLALLAMFGLAGYAIRFVRIPMRLSAARALFPMVVAGSVLLLPFYILESLLYRTVPVTSTSIGAIVSIALLVSCAAMLLWNTGNRLVGANRASIFINLVPVFGVLLAVSFLGESFELWHLSGMVMIASGVFLVMR
ncbi:MAG TPA: DMT family transporter, partial [Pseudomonadales bacterium]|nr:DMT family transporter [Pseudomonadales bacterium]